MTNTVENASEGRTQSHTLHDTEGEVAAGEAIPDAGVEARHQAGGRTRARAATDR